MLSPPAPATTHASSATAHASAYSTSAHAHTSSAETTAEGAARSHAAEAAVALGPRHAAIVVTTEDAVIAGPAALLKARVSEALFGAQRTAIGGLGPATAEPAAASANSPIAREAAGHLAIGVRHAKPVVWIVHPI